MASYIEKPAQFQGIMYDGTNESAVRTFIENANGRLFKDGNGQLYVFKYNESSYDQIGILQSGVTSAYSCWILYGGSSWDLEAPILLVNQNETLDGPEGFEVA